MVAVAKTAASWSSFDAEVLLKLRLTPGYTYAIRDWTGAGPLLVARVAVGAGVELAPSLAAEESERSSTIDAAMRCDATHPAHWLTGGRRHTHQDGR